MWRHSKSVVQSIWSYFVNRKSNWKFARGCLLIGGALLVGPLWVPFLIGIIETKFSVKINEPSPWLGVVVIGFGLIAILAPEILEHFSRNSSERQLSDSKKKHDAYYAKKIIALLPQDKFDWFMHMIGDTHTLREKDRDMLKHLEDEFLNDETGFIEEEMREYEGHFRDSIIKILEFSALNFFVPDNPRLSDQFWMFPAGNWDRGIPTPEQEKQYGVLRRELNSLLDDLEKNRRLFIKACRERLLLE